MSADKKYPAKHARLINLSTAVGILLAVHFFGLIGLLLPSTRHWFEIATPFNLLLSALLLFYFHQDWHNPFLVFIILTFLAGYWVEVLGVKTQLLFGEYTYQTALGFKLLNVPVIIGVNWLVLVYTTGVICYQMKSHFLLKSFLGAALMTGMDFLIEPVAIRHNFWSWADHSVPLQNYAAWLLVSFVLQLVFYLLPFRKNNHLAKYLIIIEMSFFILLQTGHYILTSWVKHF